MFFVLFAVYYPSFSAHLKIASQPTYFNDDVRQFIWPLFKFHEQSVFEDDYVANYFLSLMPAGYKTTYFIASKFAHPRIISKILTHILLLLILIMLFISAYRLAGPIVGLATLAFGLSCSQYILEHSAGGLPHSFGLITTSMVMYALIARRHFFLIFTTIASAAFYPPIAVLSGISLFLYFLLPLNFGGSETRWSFKRRILVVGITALLSVMVMIPNYVALAPYGSAINSENPDHIKRFPERIDRQWMNAEDEAEDELETQVSFKAIVLQSFLYARGAIRDENLFFGYFPPIWKKLIYGYIFILLIFGSVRLWFLNDSAKRLFILVYSILICSVVSVMLYPYFFYPSRYIIHTLPLMVVILIPASLGAMSTFSIPKVEKKKSPKANLIILSGTVFLLLFFGNKGPIYNGLTIHVPDKDLEIYQFIRSLSPRAVIAGWPSDEIMDNTPYYADRKVLLNYETHTGGFHEKYLLEMRRRWKMFVDAYFNPSAETTKQLSEIYGVTHMLISKSHLEPTHTPNIFRYLTMIFVRSGEI